VLDEAAKLKTGVTRQRWQAAAKDKAFGDLIIVPLLEMRADHFLRALETGTVSTNVFVRRMHNFALAMNWLPVPVIPRSQWPGVRFKEKRGITHEEHERIIARERNPELRSFYELLWATGGSQSDIACLTVENVDWEAHVLSYVRAKTGSLAQLHFDAEVTAILRQRPQTGPLFPRLAVMHERHRAKLFRRRCLGLGIEGVSLYSYRYAWAERVRRVGMAERFAQEALGRNSKAVHRAQAKRAVVKVSSLEEPEQRMDHEVIPFPHCSHPAPVLPYQDDRPNGDTPSETPASASSAPASVPRLRRAG
jgi:integrase